MPPPRKRQFVTAVLFLVPVLTVFLVLYAQRNLPLPGETESETYYRQQGVFDKETLLKLKEISEKGRVNPNAVTEDDLRYAADLLNGKKLNGTTSELEFGEVALVLMEKRDAPPGLRSRYKEIGVQMIQYRGDEKTGYPIAYNGCVLLSRTRDRSALPYMQAFLNDASMHHHARHRQLVQNCIRRIEKANPT